MGPLGLTWVAMMYLTPPGVGSTSSAALSSSESGAGLTGSPFRNLGKDRQEGPEATDGRCVDSRCKTGSRLVAAAVGRGQVSSGEMQKLRNQMGVLLAQECGHSPGRALQGCGKGERSVVCM